MALSLDMTFVLSRFAVALGRICILHWVHVFTGCFNIPVFFVVFIKKPGLDCSDSCFGLSLNASPNMVLVLYLCWVFLFSRGLLGVQILFSVHKIHAMYNQEPPRWEQLYNSAPLKEVRFWCTLIFL